MSLFIKLFNTTAEYNAYTADTANFIKPNVSCSMDDLTTVHYNPWVETRVVAKYNVTDTSSPTPIGYSKYISGFSAIEIDGVVQPSVVSAYTFSTTGEHTVKYTLTDPTRIGVSAFDSCRSLTSIDIPDSVTSIGGGAFYGCSGLTSIDIPSGVTSIGGNTFRGCSGLTSCTIGSGVTSIGYDAFYQCSSLTSIDIPSGVTSIGNSAFRGCSGLTSCTIGSGIISIGNNAFDSCSSLTSINIPSGVTSIGEGVFYQCSSLTSIDIPSGVTSIGEYAFYYCSGLTSITCNAATAPTIQSSTFQGLNRSGTLTVPSGSSGYDTWMQNANYYLGLYHWTKVEQ